MTTGESIVYGDTDRLFFSIQNFTKDIDAGNTQWNKESVIAHCMIKLQKKQM